MPGAHPIALRAASLAIGLVVTVVLLELVGRVVGYLPSRPSDAYVRLTSQVGPLPEPDSRVVWGSPGGEYRTLVRFNALGFRSDAIDFPAKRTPAERHVLVLGDSYTAAWHVPLEERWTERVMALRPGWTTLNLGMPAWGLDREYLAFVHYPLAANPDVALLLAYPANDPPDTARTVLTGVRAPYPHFEPRGGEVRGFASLEPFGWTYRNPFDRPGELAFPERIPAWLDLHSVTWRGIRDARRLLAERRAAPAPPARATNVREALEVFRKGDDDPRWRLAWQITEALLRQMRDHATGRGIRFVVALAPYYGAVQPATLRRSIGDEADGLDVGVPYRRFADIARANDIPLLDLTPGFRAFYDADPRRRDLFFAEDKHFTTLGHCVAAVLVATWLEPERPLDVAQCR